MDEATGAAVGALVITALVAAVSFAAGAGLALAFRLFGG